MSLQGKHSQCSDSQVPAGTPCSWVAPCKPTPDSQDEPSGGTHQIGADRDLNGAGPCGLGGSAESSPQKGVTNTALEESYEGPELWEPVLRECGVGLGV